MLSVIWLNAQYNMLFHGYIDSFYIVIAVNVRYIFLLDAECNMVKCTIQYVVSWLH